MHSTPPEELMTNEQRRLALQKMRATVNEFYHRATSIGVHPFIEFAGVMGEYVKLCEEAHVQGIDFSNCNTHSGHGLPFAPHNIAYINEKLECIFTGASVMSMKDPEHKP